MDGLPSYRALTHERYNSLRDMPDTQTSPRQLVPWFIATEKFDKSDPGWAKYIAWSGLQQLDEVISLDCSLCPTVLPNIKTDYWTRIVNKDFMICFFTDLEFLRIEAAGILRKNLLCVFRNPFTHPSTAEVPEGFEFIGYDLVEKESGMSALTNCGGFPKAFSNGELSEKGLLRTLERARTVQGTLVREYPNEHHANCHLWAIFRSKMR